MRLRETLIKLQQVPQRLKRLRKKSGKQIPRRPEGLLGMTNKELVWRS